MEKEEKHARGVRCVFSFVACVCSPLFLSYVPPHYTLYRHKCVWPCAVVVVCFFFTSCSYCWRTFNINIIYIYYMYVLHSVCNRCILWINRVHVFWKMRNWKIYWRYMYVRKHGRLERKNLLYLFDRYTATTTDKLLFAIFSFWSFTCMCL